MRYIIDHDFHIHSTISSCCPDPRQTKEAILDYANKNNFNKICLTDHFWDSAVPGASEWYKPQNFEHICQALPLPQSDKVKFYFGCETEMDKHFTIGVSEKVMEKLDFIIVPVNHFHMTDFTIWEKDCTPEGRADALVTHVGRLLEQDLPFEKMGIAHLAIECLDGTCDPKARGYLKVLDLIEDAVYRELFEKAAQKGIGIELNSTFGEEYFTPEESVRLLRPFRIAKQCGCKFYLGSDAHTIDALGKAMQRFDAIIDAIGLEESDKFTFGA